MAAKRTSSDSSAAPGRVRIALACSVCGNRNYRTNKSRREGESIKLKKFCSHCSEHTLHIEGK